MICSFCATQLPADACYCAECGRPAMSRRAGRSAAVAPKKSKFARAKRPKKNAAAAAALSVRRRTSTENVESTSTSTYDADAREQTHHRSEPAHAASTPVALHLGEPLVLSDIANGTGISAQSAESPSSSESVTSAASSDSARADELEAHDVGNFPGGSGRDADAVWDDEGGAIDESLPLDEEGPYDEVADPLVLRFDEPASDQPVGRQADPVTDGSWRDLPAPNPQEIAWPNSRAALADESPRSEYPDADAGNTTADAEADTAGDADNSGLSDNSDAAGISEAIDDRDGSARVDDEAPFAEVIERDELPLRDEGDGDGELVSSSDDLSEETSGPESDVVPIETGSGTDLVGAGADDAGEPVVLESTPDPEPVRAPELEPVALVEPEPLVEPSPLPRSPFEPDLSKVGRPEAVASVQERSPVKSVRPLGDEPVFTTADRLSASTFAPVASERVSDQPALPRAAKAAESEVASLSGTAPRVSDSFTHQPREGIAGHAGAPRSTATATATATASSVNAVSQTQMAARDAAEAVCAQCGASLSDSDIFCGSCGFVKHGVGPTARAVSRPALDPFPWGKPTPRASSVEETPESGPTGSDVDPATPEPVADNQHSELNEHPKPNQHSEPDADKKPIAEDEPSELAASSEPAESAQSAESSDWGDPTQASETDTFGEHSSAVVAADAGDVDATSADGEPVNGAEVESSRLAAMRTSTPDAPFDLIEVSDAISAAQHNRDWTAGEFDRLTAVPHPSETGDESVGGDRPAPTASDETSATPGLSVLAPPPMSQHRVELPIAPPTPLASRTSDDEDIEDTRIVERNISGTRFVLQFSTGDSVIVTGTGLVGRHPIAEPSEKFDILVPITDPSKSVSKTHLEFGQMAGAFWISDRYSGNGTVVREPGGKPKRCEPSKRYRVMRGTRVEIGEQFFIVS